jgi:hypothetical protein
MFSALKFVVAAVIVALFGGFLLAGVLTTQHRDEVAPAAVTESPPPMTTEELLSGMVTEEVQPGVLRVVNDGVRDVAIPDTGTPNSGLSISPDGGIWVFEERKAYRLGEAPTHDWGRVTVWAPEVAPDGTLWGATDDSGISSFDGESWAEHDRLAARTHPYALTIEPDGTGWATASDESGCPAVRSAPDCRRTVLIRVDETGASTARGWEEVYEGSLSWHKPLVSPDGDVWLVGRGDAPAWYPVEAFLRYDGNRWQVIDVPEGLATADMGESFGFGADGALWAAAGPSDAEESGAHDGLARLDESGWTIFTEADGVRPWGGEFWFATDYLRVAPDGAVWVNAANCDGVAGFDGTTWTPYLRSHCVDDFDITPDGAVWVLASADHDDPIHAYVITPEAVAATE